MKRIIAAVSISTLLLLAGCGRSEIENTEEFEEEGQLVIEIDLQDEDEQEILESPYKEVLDYFNGWELPEKGRASLDDEAYKKYDPEQFVIYENGFVFDKHSKTLTAHILPEKQDDYATPFDEQIPGVLKRYIADAADFGHIEVSHIGDPDIFQESLDFFYASLEKIEDLNDFPPLDQWVQETTAAFETAEREKDPDKKWEAFSNGLQHLDKMQWLVLN